MRPTVASLGVITVILLAVACQGVAGETTHGIVRLAVATTLEQSADCVVATATCAPLAMTWADGTLAELLDNVDIRSGTFGKPVRIRITSVPSRSAPAFAPAGLIRDVRTGDTGWVPAGMLD